MDSRILFVSTFAVGTVVGGLAGWLGFPDADLTTSEDQRTPAMVTPTIIPSEGSDGQTPARADEEREDYLANFEKARQTWLMSGSWRELQEVAHRWAADEPEKAFLTYLELFRSDSGFDTLTRRNLMAQIFLEWGKVDPEAALGAIPILEDRATGEQFASAVFWGFAETDAAAAFAYLQNSPAFQKPEFYGRVFGKWAEQDHKAAILQLQSLDNPALRREATIGLINSWAAQDPAGAFQWTKTLSNTRLRDEALKTVVFHASREWGDPDTASQALEEMSNGPEKRQIADEYFAAWERMRSTRDEQ